MKNYCVLCVIACIFLVGTVNRVDAANTWKQPGAVRPSDGIARTSLVLHPQDADLQHAPGVIVEPQSPPYNLGGWRGDAYVVFPVNVSQAGAYAISIVYSRNAPQEHIATVQVIASRGFTDNDLKSAPHFTTSLPPTGHSWSNYKTLDLGTLSLYQGKNYLIFSDWHEDKNAYLMNLREVRLTQK